MIDRNQLSMNNVVTARFVECHDFLKSTSVVKSSRQFALSIGYQPQSLNNILKGKRDVPLEVLRKAIENFSLNPEYIFLGTGDMIVQCPESTPLVVTDQNNEERIVYVPIAAQAGYGHNLTEQTFFQELPTFSLPDYKYKQGTHRCFDVAGDSMEPTLFAGDKVICSFIEPMDWAHAIKDHCVYVIVTKGDVLVKRVVNKLRDNKCLELFSDNNYYDPYVIEGGDILELWYVTTKISPFMASPSHVRNALHEEINILKGDLGKQSGLIQNLNKTIEILIKQSRTR